MMYEMSSSGSARKRVGKERQASEGSSQANVCLGEPQPEPAGAGGPECKLRLRACPAVIEGAALPYSHTGQSLAEGCLERTSTPRHFQLCGRVGKATPEAKGRFRKRSQVQDMGSKSMQKQAGGGGWWCTRKGLRGCKRMWVECCRLYVPIAQMQRPRLVDQGFLTCSPGGVRVAIAV